MKNILKFRLSESIKGKNTVFLIITGSEDEPSFDVSKMALYLINDLYLVEEAKKLLNFLNQAIEGNPTRDEFWTMGFTAKIINKDDKKIIKVFFRLTDDYEPGYISPEEFKEILEIYIREKEEFEKDPEKYAEKLKKETK